MREMINCPWDVLLAKQEHLFCERQLCGWIVEPANTWSNISYLIAAIFILRSPRSTTRTFFGITTLVLFFGSTFFHMSGTHWGKMLDVSAMLVLSGGILALSLQQWFQWDNQRATKVFIGLLIPSLAFLFTFGFGNLPFGLEIVSAIVLEFFMMRQGRSLYQAKLLLLTCVIEIVAFTFMVLDRTKIWCQPDEHFLNGHALWHLLSGLAIYLAFRARKTS
jgi:hypothetical protein